METHKDPNVPVKFYSPWTNTIARLKLPEYMVNQFIELTDMLMKDKEAEDFGYTLAGQIGTEIRIDTNRLPEYSQRWILNMVSQYVKHCLIQSHAHVENTVKDIAKEKFQAKFNSMWMISQKDNEYNPMHVHTNCDVSAVFYLKIPEYLPGRKEHINPDGSIVFINNTGTDTRYSNSIAPFWPIVGDMFIFGGKQLHGVYPFRTKDGKGERRSVSFNASVNVNSFGEVAMKETAQGSAREEKFKEGLIMKEEEFK